MNKCRIGHWKPWFPVFSTLILNPASHNSSVMPIGRPRAILAVALCLVPTILGLVTQPALAGIGTSDVVVVVNGSSLNSRTLANHFIALRNIPPQNVVVLNDVPNSETIDVSSFRKRILSPLLQELDRRKISAHVQCITYSADFPTAISVESDFKGRELNKVLTKTASINGLTFLYQQVASSRTKEYIGLSQNFYARAPLKSQLKYLPGIAPLETWASIEKKIEAKDFLQAAQDLEQMFGKHPHLYPLAYRAAANYADGGQTSKALELLNRAVNAGWSSAKFLAADERFAALEDNDEFQTLLFALDSPLDDGVHVPPISFSAHVRWTQCGEPITDRDIARWQNEVGPEFQPITSRFLLSTVLGVTRGGGTKLSEAIEALQKSAKSDFTHPDGGFYFCHTSDIRSRTREPGFANAIMQLREMGYEAERVRNPYASNRQNVIGMQLGTSEFEWQKEGSTFLPGAIAENLTSYGGIMKHAVGQTRLSELIRAGAAASSGTVAEPYAIQPKFPTPMLYSYYAQGASLAEAFYLSITGPYQLLIVGDPLCRPFSNAPAYDLDQRLRFLSNPEDRVLELQPTGVSYEDWLDNSQPKAKKPQPFLAAKLAVLIDGVRARDIGRPRTLDLTKLLPEASLGYHDLTLRCTSDDPLLQRRDYTIPVWMGEQGIVRLSASRTRSDDAETGASTEVSQQEQSAEADDQETDNSSTFAFRDAETTSKEAPLQVSLQDKAIAIQLSSPRATSMTLWHDSEALDTTQESDSQIFLDLSRIGMGPARLSVTADIAGKEVRSFPLWIEVLP